MRRTTIGALTLATLPLLALTACSDDDTSDESTGATTAGTAMTDDTTMSDGTAMTDDTAMSDGACPDETVLTIANTDTDADGELEASWALADDGPGYSNGDDTNMELAFSDFDFPEDEQFGIQIPVGVPSDLPEGDTFVNISMFNPDETIAADQTYIDQLVFDEDPTVADGKVNFFAAYLGSERLGTFGDVQVTITELTDERVCGTIETLGSETQLQSLATVEGDFIVDRIEYLDGDTPTG